MTTLRSRISPRTRGIIRWVGGAAILAIVVGRIGTGPFLHGLRSVDAWSLVLAIGIGALTTVCAAGRWHLVARGLGVAVPLRAATAAYYRSQLLNSVLPGGVLGDVDRAVRHGSRAGDVGLGLRAVAWERSAGQLVQLAVGLVVLISFASPVPSWLPAVVAAVIVTALGGSLVLTARPPRGMTRWARALRAAAGDLRQGLLARQTWPGIVASSVVVVSGHLATLLLAARAAGVSAPTVQLLPLAVLVLLATAVPTNVAGFGPREGVAAWVFAAAGLGAAQGVATATAYALLSLAAVSPAVPLLVVAALGRRREDRPGGRVTSNSRVREFMVTVVGQRSV